MRSPMSGSREDITWLLRWIMVIFRPRICNASAISRPMYPPPTITAVFGRCSSSACLSREPFTRLWTSYILRLSMPSSGGRAGLAPVAKSNWSKCSQRSMEEFRSFTRTFFFNGSTTVTSCLVCTLIFCFSRNACGVLAMSASSVSTRPAT